jgi:hypothetical protein
MRNGEPDLSHAVSETALSADPGRRITSASGPMARIKLAGADAWTTAQGGGSGFQDLREIAVRKI